MSGYAQNPSSSSDPDYAPLTAGLLARKGEALPAVDADAHAGVDIDMHRAVSVKNANEGFTRQTVANLYPSNSTGAPNLRESYAQQEQAEAPVLAPTPPAYVQNSETQIVRPTHNNRIDASPISAPESEAASQASLHHKYQSQRTVQSVEEKPTQRRAAIRFRMPVEDLVRLRIASRDMEMSCQAIILEALECYLDANDIAPVTEEECKAELHHLAEMSTRKRAASEAVAAVSKSNPPAAPKAMRQNGD